LLQYCHQEHCRVLQREKALGSSEATTRHILTSLCNAKAHYYFTELLTSRRSPTATHGSKQLSAPLAHATTICRAVAATRIYDSAGHLLLSSTNIIRLKSPAVAFSPMNTQEPYVGVLRRAIPGMETACQRDLLSGSRGWRIGNGSGINAVEVRCRLAGCGLQGAWCMAVSRVGLGLGGVVLVRRVLDCRLGVFFWFQS
jgi:hypothetical protein